MKVAEKHKSVKGYGGRIEDPEPRENSSPSRVWRKKYECKVNKGEHTFVPGTHHRFLDGEWVTYPWMQKPTRMHRWVHCSACGKQNIEYKG